MTVNSTPRQIVKGLLQGIAPPRPLFLPIVFSAGARVENQPLPAFLANPTKICNAQRQLRGPLRTDGFSCYFDPFLEVEALGATLHWGAAGQSPTVHWPRGVEPGELPDDLRSPEEAVKAGRVPIALEVLRRLKAMLRDDSILMAGVTGPFTLAARISQPESAGAGRARDLPESAVELAASVVTRISGALVEAGASLVMILEEVLPALSQERCVAWASALEPAFNVIRFYEALPVLQLTESSSLAANSAVILSAVGIAFSARRSMRCYCNLQVRPLSGVRRKSGWPCRSKHSSRTIPLCRIVAICSAGWLWTCARPS